VPASTIPNLPEETQGQETPVTENVTKEAAQEERSTANSPPKGSPKRLQRDLPRVEVNDKVDEGPQEGNGIVDEQGPVVQDQAFREEEQLHPRQDQNPTNNEEPSNRRSPTSDHVDMSHYFESSNEEDISAQPGGSSIDPQSSTSKISAAAGIP
jgi:hypothetical protein